MRRCIGARRQRLGDQRRRAPPAVRLCFCEELQSPGTGEEVSSGADNPALRRRSQRVHEKQAKAGLEAAAGMDSTQAWAEPPGSEAVCIMAALEAAFCACPQTVLSTCLSALKKGQGELCGGARHLLTRNLLSIKGQQSSTPDTESRGCLAERVLASREDVQAWLRSAITLFKSRAALGCWQFRSMGAAGADSWLGALRRGRDREAGKRGHPHLGPPA